MSAERNAVPNNAPLEKSEESIGPSSPTYHKLKSFHPRLIHAGRGDVETFMKSDFGSLHFDFEHPNFFYPPIFTSPEDRQYFNDQFWRRTRPPIGKYPNESLFLTAPEKYVVGLRGLEGLVFDEEEIFKGYPFFNMVRSPTPFVKIDDQIAIEDRLLKKADFLDDTYIIPYNGVVHNYYHTLIECMVGAFAMTQIAPNTKILVPQSIALCKAVDHVGILSNLFDADRLVSYSGIVRVKKAIWAHGDGAEQVPRKQYQDFRQHVISRHGIDSEQDRKVFIKRRGIRSIANSKEIDDFVAELGFGFYYLEDLPFIKQVELFNSASFIIAPHGAGLSNLIFCRPKTKVIELAPHMEFRPHFWMTADKMGLYYSVLPTKSIGAQFNGNLEVSLPALKRAVRALDSYAS